MTTACMRTSTILVIGASLLAACMVDGAPDELFDDEDPAIGSTSQGSITTTNECGGCSSNGGSGWTDIQAFFDTDDETGGSWGFRFDTGDRTADGWDFPGSGSSVTITAAGELDQWMDQSSTSGYVNVRHFIECALPSSKTVTLVHNNTTIFSNAAGQFNLYPDLWDGTDMTTAQEEKMTACLLARFNSADENVNINVVGPSAFGTGMNSRDSTDHSNYPQVEAAFGGNFWHPNGGGKIFMCGAVGFSGEWSWDHKPHATATRACAGGNEKDGSNNWWCSAIHMKANCSATGSGQPACSQTNTYGSEDPYYDSCYDSVNGVTWNNMLTVYLDARVSNGNTVDGPWDCNSFYINGSSQCANRPQPPPP